MKKLYKITTEGGYIIYVVEKSYDAAFLKFLTFSLAPVIKLEYFGEVLI